MSLLAFMGCSPSNEDSKEITVNVGIPVRAPSAKIGQNFSSLMSITPGVDCYQNQLVLATYDVATEKIIASKRVALRTNLSNAITYTNAGAAVDQAISHFIGNSYFDEPLKLLVSRAQNVEIGLMGTFYEPKDVNGDGICDDVNYVSINNSWADKGALNNSRSNHTATKLQDGSVLVVGGYNGTYMTSTERYNPSTGTWTVMAALTGARKSHTATLLEDGRVVVIGGNNSGTSLTTVEIYNPTTNSWTAGANMALGRYGHTATLLSNGNILVTGGFTGAATQSTVSYNPTTNTWTTLASMNYARYDHTATLLTDGKVLVVGGYNAAVIANVEVYDPTGNTWTNKASLASARSQHSANLLGDGKVLVMGGYDGSLGKNNVDVYTPTTDVWVAKSPLANPRYAHTASPIGNGKFLLAGGRYSSAMNSTEVFDYLANTNTNVSGMAYNRGNHTAVVLNDGRVLVTGGFDAGYQTGTEISGIYYPALRSTSLVGHVPVTSNAFSAGSVALKIDVLHATPNSPFYILQSPRHKDWSEVPSGFTAGTGTAYLSRIDWLRGENNAPLISHELNPTNVTSDKFYIPHMFPYYMRFRFFGSSTACADNTNPCSGEFEAVVNGGGGTITATWVPGTGTTSNPPDSPITGTFPLNTY